VRDVWAFDPVPAELTPEQAEHVLGGQGNLWSEHLDGPRRVDYQLWPRACALAEALWVGGADRDWDEFSARLDAHLERLDVLGVEYRHADGPRPWERIPGIAGRPSTREQRKAWVDEITANIASS
jgi:hexosaminidase